MMRSSLILKLIDMSDSGIVRVQPTLLPGRFAYKISCLAPAPQSRSPFLNHVLARFAFLLTWHFCVRRSCWFKFCGPGNIPSGFLVPHRPDTRTRQCTYCWFLTNIQVSECLTHVSAGYWDSQQYNQISQARSSWRFSLAESESDSAQQAKCSSYNEQDLASVAKSQSSPVLIFAIWLRCPVTSQASTPLNQLSHYLTTRIDSGGACYIWKIDYKSGKINGRNLLGGC